LQEIEDMDRAGLAMYDYYGTWRPVKEVLAERRSEVAANEAGQTVGLILGTAISGKRTYDEARKEIFELLCDH